MIYNNIISLSFKFEVIPSYNEANTKQTRKVEFNRERTVKVLNELKRTFKLTSKLYFRS